MKIGIIDIETCGFLRENGVIVEVGIVSLDTKTGKIDPVFSSVCREKHLRAKHRDAWIFKNSDLTVEEVRTAPDLTEIVPLIQEHIDNLDAITAYNKNFDFNFLRNRGIRIDREWPCPMLAATQICKLPGNRGGYKWPKVEEAWKHFFPDEPYTEAHRGFDDALHEARIVYELHKIGAMIDA
jgi:DNA polymerase-3 subunit epsilon